MFSKACMYGIRAVALVASQNTESTRWNLRRIVAETGAPEAFMAKVLQQLVHAEILVSVKGPGGGFEMDPARRGALKLGDVVQAIDGDSLFSGCALGFPKCDARRPCPIHDQVMQVRERLQKVLASTRIDDLGSELDHGAAFLKAKL